VNTRQTEHGSAVGVVRRVRLIRRMLQHACAYS
jgi:hypothetical protein